MVKALNLQYSMKPLALGLLACSTLGALALFGTGSLLAPLANFFPQQSHASTPSASSQTPQGFELLNTAPGVQVYRRDNGLQSYVTVLNLAKGELRNLTGEVTPEKLVNHRSLLDYWQAAQQQPTQRQAKVVINGTFFARYNRPTDIAFGLKTNGQLITYGYGLQEFPELNKTVAWDNTTGELQIAPYARATFDGRFPNVVGALDMNAGKRSSQYLPRTFIGHKGRQVFIFSSNYARQIDAVRALQDFGAESIAMLDGGGSTGLVVDGKEILKANTKVPHGIAIYSDRQAVQ
jgi:hypothetical protein